MFIVVLSINHSHATSSFNQYNYTFYDYIINFKINQYYNVTPLNITVEQTLIGFSIKITENISPISIYISPNSTAVISFPYINFTYVDLFSIHSILIKGEYQQTLITIQIHQLNISKTNLNFETSTSMNKNSVFLKNNYMIILIILTGIILYIILKQKTKENK